MNNERIYFRENYKLSTSSSSSSEIWKFTISSSSSETWKFNECAQMPGFINCSYSEVKTI